MKHYMPEIFWHGNREALMSVDVQKFVQSQYVYRVASASMATPEIRLWDLDASKDKPKLEFVAELGNSVHESGVNVIRYNPDGKYLASGGIDRLVVIWEKNESMAPDIFACKEEDAVVNKENWVVKKRLRYHVGDVCELCWSPDSTYVASVAMDKTLVIWNITNGQKVKELTPDYHRLFLNGLSWDPRNMYLTAQGVDRCFYVYDIRNPKGCRCIGKVDKAVLPEGDTPIRLFHDDTLMTFNRRLEFSPDGELLITPAGCLEIGNELVYVSYIFTRSELFSPSEVLPTGGKASVAARWCPVIFKLIDGIESNFDLPYRMIVAIACQDSVVLYDTQQDQPIFTISSVHYLSLTDCAWSPDGQMLMICSQDGYSSFFLFKNNELGTPYVDPPVPVLPSPPAVKPKKESKRESLDKSKRELVEKPKRELAEKAKKEPVDATAKANSVDEKRRKSLAHKKTLIQQMENAKNKKREKNVEDGEKKEEAKTVSPEKTGSEQVEQSPLASVVPKKPVVIGTPMPVVITKNDIVNFFKPRQHQKATQNKDSDEVMIIIPSPDKSSKSSVSECTSSIASPITPGPTPRRVAFTTITTTPTAHNTVNLTTPRASDTNGKMSDAKVGIKDAASKIVDSPVSHSPAKTPRRVQFTTIS